MSSDSFSETEPTTTSSKSFFYICYHQLHNYMEFKPLYLLKDKDSKENLMLYDGLRLAFNYFKLSVAFYLSFQRNQGVNVLSLFTAFLSPSFYILHHYATQITSLSKTC